MPGTTFIQVILPLRLEWEPYYSVPEGMEVHVGERVRVIIAGKEKTGVVSHTGVTPKVDADRIRPILGPAEGLADISPEEIEFWRFISNYYLCRIGEVYKAAYPELRVRSEKVAAKKKKAEEPAAACRRATGRGNARKPSVLIAPSRKETYVNEAKAVLAQGRDVLILVPETATGEVLQSWLKQEFGDILRIYNSRQTPVRRRKTADSLRECTDPMLIVGTRSALFLPYRNLGLVIVDEEQDPSYKQYEPNPRYNGRDAAVVLAGIHGAKSILGTSCPSLETELNLRRGKYELHSPRADNCPAEIIDIPAEIRKNGMKGLFSIKLMERIREAEDVVLVRGWEQVQEIEEQAAKLFPGKAITVQTASSAQNDITRVDLIALLQADAFFRKDDFRSDERTKQLLHRLSSRTGHLVIQTAKSAHPVFSSQGAATVDMLQERKDFNLPPFTRIVDVRIEDNNEKRLALMSRRISDILPSPRMNIPGENAMTFRLTLPVKDASKAKEELFNIMQGFEKSNRYEGHVIIDVDPA